MLGRLPVKTATELQALVTKIIGYETAAGGMDWRSRALFFADNYRDAAGNPDSAGDFAAFADQSAAQLAPGFQVQRLYYDPASTHQGVPWREPDATRANHRTRELLSGGAGLATYV